MSPSTITIIINQPTWSIDNIERSKSSSEDETKGAEEDLDYMSSDWGLWKNEGQIVLKARHVPRQIL